MNLLDLVAKIVAVLLGLGGVIYGAAKLIASFASGDGSLKAEIKAGFKSLGDRFDRLDKDRDEEKRARQKWEDEANRKAIADAVRMAQAEERSAHLTQAVRALQEKVDDLVRDTAADHEDVVQRLTRGEEAHREMAGKVGAIERRLSGQMPAVK